MLKLKSYKYYIFLISALAICWVIFKVIDLNFVFNILDTYYVVQYSDIIVIFIIPILLIGLIYWLFSKSKITLIKNLVNIHNLTTIFGIVLLVIIFLFNKFISPLGSSSRFPLFNESENTSVTLITLCIVILASQILFVINVIISLIRYFFYKNEV